MTMNKAFCFFIFTIGVSLLALEPIVLDDFSTTKFWKASNKVQVTPTDGPNGLKAITVSNLPSGTATHSLSLTAEERDVWDQYQGISFYAKGDGSDCWSPIVISYSGNYSYCYFIPMKNTEWVKYTVPWKDFIPEAFAGLIGTANGMPPCGISSIRIGSRWSIWYNNDKIPTHSVSIANIVLEPKVDFDKTMYKPAPFSKVLEKLRKREKVLIQFQGDSITCGVSLQNKVKERYSIKTEELLRKWLKTDNITTVNRAVGGAKTNDLRAWLNRDFSGETPDLVTIWIGYNDVSGASAVSYYKDALGDYIDRIAAKTKGQSSILLFATGAGAGCRFTMQDAYAQAVRDLAKERGIECFDINALMKAVGKLPLGDKYLADTAHPNAAGHLFVTDKLCEYLIEKAGIKEPKPLPPPKPVAQKGGSYSWDFENGQDNWKLEKFVSITDEKAKDGKHSIKMQCNKDKKDYERAWSDYLPVQAGQKYVAKVDIAAELNDGEVKMFIVEYASKGGKYGAMKNVCSTGNPSWKSFKKAYEVPEGVSFIRVLLWVERRAHGTVYADNVKLEAVE